MKTHLAKVSLALLSTVFLLGCQEQGSGAVGPEGPQFTHNDPGKVHGGPKGGGNGDGGGGGDCKDCDFVDVVLDGWMITDPLTQINQMELVRKLGIMKIRANTEKIGTKFLKFAIFVEKTLATFTGDADVEKNRVALRNGCEWSGRVEQTVQNETWVVEFLLDLILDNGPKERSVLARIDESALVQDPNNPGVFVGVSEDNKMAIWPGFRVGGSPTVTVEGDRDGNFTATFSGGHLDMRGIPPWERNQIILRCDITAGDEITFDVMRRS